MNRRLTGITWGYVVGISFLVMQLVSIGYARFIPTRFFCWAPYDQHTRYHINVVLNDSSLTTREVQKRYRYPADIWEPRRIDNVFSIIQQYETTYGQSDKARVTVTYTTNGRPEKTWQWPE